MAQAAFIVGILYAAVSVYWGLGGTWLLETVGGSLERQARAGNVGVFAADWAGAVLKISAAVLPLLALRRLTSPAWNRRVWVLAWTAAGILTTYGLLQSTVALLAQSGAISASGTADSALAWHAYLWDPWFFIWGLLAAAALLRGRHGRSQTPAWA